MAKAKQKTNVNKYLKEDILKSEKYRKNKDVLTIVLKDNMLYTKQEIDELINSFVEAKVVKHINQ